jgi:hypothetical protein
VDDAVLSLGPDRREGMRGAESKDARLERWEEEKRTEGEKARLAVEEAKVELSVLQDAKSRNSVIGAKLRVQFRL